MSRVYAFIDGASFEKNISPILNSYGCKFEELDWLALTKNADRIFYFDALPIQKSNQTDEVFKIALEKKQAMFSHLRRVPNVHVREGITRRKNSGSPTLQQKGVDIALAVEVLTHAHNDNVEVVRIFASDADFYPLLDALTSTRVRSELYFWPNSVSQALVEAADFAEELNHYTIHPALPYTIKQKYSITGLSEDTSKYLKYKTGKSKYGQVYLYQSPFDDDQFVIRGKLDEHNAHVAKSASHELLVDHYETSIRSKIDWD